MPRRNGGAIPAAPRKTLLAAPRKTLLEWIDNDDGDTSSFNQPACSEQAQALHTQVVYAPVAHRNAASEPLQPPPGLRLAPLG